ncbi:hypothetical protein ABW02_20295 [Niallia circulans]|uniref:Uncharacterized protein n=1 Tax=Niallia circulans TaxID=1397 RepID=A0A0J1IAS2_NIACI|nr:hypothetical protein [Niallia circulans]KLV23069.1 hypothetical protein ABW02_20295 [Niallia circulans]
MARYLETSVIQSFKPYIDPFPNDSLKISIERTEHEFDYGHCVHKWVDTDDGTNDKICFSCGYRVKQNVMENRR